MAVVTPNSSISFRYFFFWDYKISKVLLTVFLFLGIVLMFVHQIVVVEVADKVEEAEDEEGLNV